jgi:hypothetical protein
MKIPTDVIIGPIAVPGRNALFSVTSTIASERIIIGSPILWSQKCHFPAFFSAKDGNK